MILEKLTSLQQSKDTQEQGMVYLRDQTPLHAKTSHGIINSQACLHRSPGRQLSNTPPVHCRSAGALDPRSHRTAEQWLALLEPAAQTSQAANSCTCPTTPTFRVCWETTP